MLEKQEANYMHFLNDILWRVIRTKPFDTVRPRITRSYSYRLQGHTKPCASTFSTIILGRRKSATYFSKLLYRCKPKTELLGKRTLSNIASSIDKSERGLAIIESNYFFSRFLRENGFFVMPRIDFTLDLNISLENIQKRMSEGKRKRIRKIVKTGYTFEITKDPAKVQTFYHEMYLPHMLRRHNELTDPISFSEYMELVTEGYLLLVKKEKEDVSGCLVVPQGNELREFIMGVGGNDADFAFGSLAVSYYGIVRGIQKGYARIDFGETPPFMLDGVFQHKRELGTQVRPAAGPSAQVFGMKFSRSSEPVRNFLSANPFVFMDGTNLSGMVHLDSIDDLHQSCCVSGLSSLYIVSSNLESSNRRGFKLQKLEIKDFSNRKTLALGSFGEACNNEGYSIFRLFL
jgi:hypothetical protein